jgi:hypothetical protein
MKLGTTASPWRYDEAAAETIRPDNQRRTTILRYASWAAVFPISLVVRLPFDSSLSTSRGIDVMGQLRTGSTLELSFAAADHIGEDQLDLQAFMVCQRRIECSNIGINLLSNFIGAATVVPKCHIFKSL